MVEGVTGDIREWENDKSIMGLLSPYPVEKLVDQLEYADYVRHLGGNV